MGSSYKPVMAGSSITGIPGPKHTDPEGDGQWILATWVSASCLRFELLRIWNVRLEECSFTGSVKGY